MNTFTLLLKMTLIVCNGGFKSTHVCCYQTLYFKVVVFRVAMINSNLVTQQLDYEVRQRLLGHILIRKAQIRTDDLCTSRASMTRDNNKTYIIKKVT